MLTEREHRRYIRKAAPTKKAVWTTIVILASLLVLSGGAYLFCFIHPIYQPKAFSQPELDQIVNYAHRSHTASKILVVVLPPQLAARSITRRAYLSDDLIFIPSWIGRTTLLVQPYSPGDDWIEGYLYSAKPLPTGTFLMLNVPGFCSPWAAPHEKDCGQIEMFIDHPLAQRWYAVNSFS